MESWEDSVQKVMQPEVSTSFSTRSSSFGLEDDFFVLRAGYLPLGL